MSQTDQLVSKAIELQRNTLENGQRAVEQAVGLPLQQSVALQRNAAQLLLDGMEMGNWLGTQSVEFTRDAMDSYLRTVESAARDTSELTERGIQSAGMAGERGLDSTQRFASGFAGDGRAGARTGESGTGTPPGYRTPAQAVAGAVPQAQNADPPAVDGQQTGYGTSTEQPQVTPARSPQPQAAPARSPQPQAAPAQSPQPQAAPARPNPPRGASIPRTPPQRMSMSQAPPQQVPQRPPARGTPEQQPPGQVGFQQQAPTQQAPPSRFPSQQTPDQVAPTRQEPTGAPSQGAVGQSAQRTRAPSRVGRASPSEEPVAEQPSGRATADTQRPVGQPATVGESEREAEPSTDNA